MVFFLAKISKKVLHSDVQRPEQKLLQPPDVSVFRFTFVIHPVVLYTHTEHVSARKSILLPNVIINPHEEMPYPFPLTASLFFLLNYKKARIRSAQILALIISKLFIIPSF